MFNGIYDWFFRERRLIELHKASPKPEGKVASIVETIPGRPRTNLHGLAIAFDIFPEATAIFAKVGLEDVNSDIASGVKIAALQTLRARQASPNRRAAPELHRVYCCSRDLS